MEEIKIQITKHHIMLAITLCAIGRRRNNCPIALAVGEYFGLGREFVWVSEKTVEVAHVRDGTRIERTTYLLDSAGVNFVREFDAILPIPHPTIITIIEGITN